MVEKKKRKGNGSWSLVALFNQDFQRVAFNPPPPQKTQEGKKFNLTLEGLSLSSCKDYTVSHPLPSFFLKVRTLEGRNRI